MGPGVNPPSVTDGDPAEVSNDPSTYTSSPLTPTLSVDAAHLPPADVAVTSETAGVPGISAIVRARLIDR